MQLSRNGFKRQFKMIYRNPKVDWIRKDGFYTNVQLIQDPRAGHIRGLLFGDVRTAVYMFM